MLSRHKSSARALVVSRQYVRTRTKWYTQYDGASTMVPVVRTLVPMVRPSTVERTLLQ
jgi:hypothetical protein